MKIAFQSGKAGVFVPRDDFVHAMQTLGSREAALLPSSPPRQLTLLLLQAH